MSELEHSESQMELLKKAVDSTDYDQEYSAEKSVAYQSRRNILNTGNGTPIKRLIDDEISKELSCNPKPPGVVARLMGLDPTPAHDLISSRGRTNSEGYLLGNALRNNGSYELVQIQGGPFTQEGNTISWYPRNGLQEKHLQCGIQCHSIFVQEDCTDVPVVLQSSKVKKETYDGYLAENKMDLVRRKFIEAKRLATDENLRQSREFQEALQVLSSNRDLFLEFLQEPSYMFPRHLDKQPFQPRPQSKRITVLKPSKAMAGEQFNIDTRHLVPGSKNGELGKKQQTQHQHLKKQQLAKAKEPGQSKPLWDTLFDNHNAFRFRPPGQTDSSSHPTRIVVLKPSRCKDQDTKIGATFPTLSPKSKRGALHLSGPDKFSDSAAGEMEDPQGEGTNGLICGNLNTSSMCVQSTGDDQLFTSALSTQYYESSFNRSESEDIEEENLSDSEYMTPTSRHSCDLINSTPHSSSSLSRASYSPESSVSREAKKRLSERWALIARNGHSHEHEHTRSSSTLGEMLAVPEINNQTNSDTEICEEGLSMSSSTIHFENNYQEASCVFSEKVIDEGVGEGSFINLLRTRLVPVSSGVCDVAPLEGDAAKTEQKDNIAKGGNPKNGNSLRQKVSSFFFSKNKKLNKDERNPQRCLGNSREEKAIGTEISKDVSNSQKLTARNNGGSDQHPASISEKGCTTAASTPAIRQLKGVFSVEAMLNQGEYSLADILSENQEQPSPISVLDPPFEEEDPSPPVMDRSSSVRHASLSLTRGTSRISSPEPLAVTLSWEENDISGDGRMEGESVFSTLFEEQERFQFVQKVLTTAGLNEEQPEGPSFSHRWYSSSSPLDPSLLERFSKWDMHTGYYAKDAKKLRRRAMLENKLLFDCINAALLEMARPMTDVNPWSRERRRRRNREVVGGTRLLDEVWKRLQNIVSTDEIVPAVAPAESRGYVDKLLRKEMGDRGWVELEVVGMDTIGREIENDVLENLLEDAISDFAHVDHNLLGTRPR